MILLGITFQEAAINALFWISALPFALLGLELPSVKGDSRVGNKGITWQGLALCLSALVISTGIVLYAGSALRPNFTAWLLFLSLLLLIRGSFYKAVSKDPTQQLEHLQESNTNSKMV